MVYNNLSNLNLSTYKYNETLLDLREIVKSASFNSKSGKANLEYKDKKKFISVSYKPAWPGPMPTTQVIPKFIPLNKETLEIFGLFQGEGLKRWRDFQFGNTNPEIIEAFLNYFEEYWDIKKNRWNVTIEFRLPDLTETKKRSLLEFWQKYGPFNRIKITHRKDLLSTKASENGHALLRIHSSVFHTVINETLSKIKDIVRDTPAYGIYYLNGLLASDGYAKLNNNRIDKIGIVTADKRTADHYKSIFTNLDIKCNIEEMYTLIIISKEANISKYVEFITLCNKSYTKKAVSENKFKLRVYSKDESIINNIYSKIKKSANEPLKILKKSKYDVFVCGWDNFFRLFYLIKIPFALHKGRNKKFIIGLTNHKRTKIINRFLSLKDPFRIKEYCSKFGVSKSSACLVLKVYERYGLIKKESRGIYSLTKKGKLITDTLKRLK